jgi:hypothetical protein
MLLVLTCLGTRPLGIGISIVVSAINVIVNIRKDTARRPLTFIIA